MKNKIWFFATFVAFAVYTKAMANPCDGDIDKYCGDIQPGQKEITSCLNSQDGQISFQCRNWLRVYASIVDDLDNACGASARDFCRDVRPGFGRVAKCLSSDYDRLPEDCRRALQNSNAY